MLVILCKSSPRHEHRTPWSEKTHVRDWWRLVLAGCRNCYGLRCGFLSKMQLIQLIANQRVKDASFPFPWPGDSVEQHRPFKHRWQGFPVWSTNPCNQHQQILLWWSWLASLGCSRGCSSRKTRKRRNDRPCQQPPIDDWGRLEAGLAG